LLRLAGELQIENDSTWINLEHAQKFELKRRVEAMPAMHTSCSVGKTRETA
jgi:hypothetical protein